MFVSGNVFIVPNKASRLDNWMSESSKEDLRHSLANVGLTAEGPLVQVWYTSQDCDNWASHRWEAHPEFFGSRGLPSYLPKRLLDGVREGGQVVLRFGELEIQLTAAQSGHRYQRFGPFEEVLEMVCA